MIKLYQFAISHFCEKVRWALEYKHIEYKAVNLMPGSHMATTRRLAPRTSVPILQNDNKIVQGSGQIITYLDDLVKEYRLTPVSAAESAAALEWEKYLDKELGVNVRRICYHYLLQNKKEVIPMMCSGTPWYNKLLLNVGFGRMEKLMRKHMKLNEKSVRQAKIQVSQALSRIQDHLSQHSFLAGEGFSRADLAAAALMAPLCMPENYPGPLPMKFPEPLASFKSTIAPKTKWVDELYKRYR